MASRGAYDGGYGPGGKIRRRPPSRAAAASPYARPAPVPTPVARGGEGSGWLTRLIARGASRLLFSVFRKPPPQLAAPPHTELFDAPPSRPETLDAPPSQPEMLDAPPSPLPPPLEDDIQEGEDNGEEIANNLCTDNPGNSDKDGDDVLRSSDLHGAMDLEELLKQRTFTRSEFEYLADLLRSRTIGSNTLKAEVSNTKQIRFPQKENASGDLPVDFSIRSHNVADRVASPAELARSYMGLRSSEVSPLRLRLHDPSSLPMESREANIKQMTKSPMLPPLPSSRLYVSAPTDHLGSSFTTPSRSAIHKMSLSPYFKSAVSSQNFPVTVSSSYQTATSVHTFGRQVMKRKSTALNNESAAVGPIRKMHRRYNRVSPLLETRPSYRGYLGNRANKLDEDYEVSRQTQKRRCLDKADDGTQGAVDNRAGSNSFGQAPAQSIEMAAKILKQLDKLVPPRMEGTSEIRETYGNAMDVKDSISQRKEIPLQGSLLESSSGVQEYTALNNINGAAKFTPASIDGRTVDASSDRSVVLNSKSSSGVISSPKESLDLENCSGSTKIDLHRANEKFEKSQAPSPEQNPKNSGATNKEKPSTVSLRSYAPSNLVLSSEIDRSKILASSNAFSFPAMAALGAHSQAPPTPTMASPPILPASSAVSSAPVSSAESAPRVFKQLSEEGSISNNRDKKSNAENPPISSKSSGHVSSFTANPVFNVVNSKPTTLINGLAHTLDSTTSANTGFSAASVLSTNPNGSNNSVLSTIADSSAASSPPFSFQPGFLTPSTSAQQSGGIQFKAEPVITAPFSSQSCSTGGSFPSSNTGPGSSSTSSKLFVGTSQSVEALSSAPSRAGTGSAPFSFSPKFGKANSLAAQDKCKAGSSGTPSNFSPQFGTFLSASSVDCLDKSKAASPQSKFLSGNQHSQSGNTNSILTHSSTSNSNLLCPENSYPGSLPRFPNSSFGSASSSSSFNSSSVFSIPAGSGSTSVTITASLSLPATSAASGTGTAFPASPIFGSNLTITAPPYFGMPNTGSAISAFNSTSSPVFSFTSATPTVPNPSPSTPLSSRANLTAGLSTGTDQMNGGNIIGDNQSPFSTAGLSTGTDQMNGGNIIGDNQSLFSTALPFGFPSNSPSTPAFSTPGTQFATSTTTSPGIFQFGSASQSPTGVFSLGPSDRNDKAGRRIFKAKRKK